MAPKKKKETAKQGESIGFNSMIKDILIAAMDKGQLLPAGFVLFLIIAICRMPPESIGELINSLISSKLVYIFGYILSAFLLIGWCFHVKWQKRIYTNELNRIGKEKSDLQNQIAGQKFESSETTNTEEE